MYICLTLPIIHSGDHFHTAPLPPRCHPLRPHGLSLGTFDIQDGQGFGLAQAIRVVEYGGFDMMVLTKTEISMTAYFRTGSDTR